MFSLARRLIEKRVVGVDAFFLCVLFPGHAVHSPQHRWVWSREAGDNTEVSPGNPLAFEVYSRRESKVTNVPVIDSEG